MLQIQNLVFDAWGRRFFDQANVSLPKDAKVGLVGRNGVGKSTLFRLIKGEFVPGSGELSLPKQARMGSVDQEHPATPVSLGLDRRDKGGEERGGDIGDDKPDGIRPAPAKPAGMGVGLVVQLMDRGFDRGPRAVRQVERAVQEARDGCDRHSRRLRHIP